MFFIVYRGQAKKEEKAAFRVAYSKLRDLRSILSQVPFLALTATATTKTRNQFQKQLGMKNPHTIVRTPDRKNIKIVVQRVKDMTCLDTFVTDLGHLGLGMPKTVVYCKSVKECAEVFAYFDAQLGEAGYISSSSMSSKTQLFCMYFHDTLEEKKQDIAKDLIAEAGHFRVIIATNALGLGVNMRGVDLVVHYGCPRDLEDYMQEIGRAGRSGAPAQALMMYKPLHLLGSSSEMKEYVKDSSTCRRMIIANHFKPKEEHLGISPAHNCCDVCAADCQCGDANSHVVKTKELEHLKVPVRTMDDDTKELLTVMLKELEEQMHHRKLAFGTRIWATMLSDKVIEHAVFIDSMDYIALNLPVICPDLAFKLYCLIKEVFDEEYEIETDVYADDAFNNGNVVFLSLLDGLHDSDFEEDIVECVTANDENVAWSTDD